MAWGTKPAKDHQGESMFGLIPTDCTGPGRVCWLRGDRRLRLILTGRLAYAAWTDRDGPAVHHPPRDHEFAL